jgi:hypothetical protein
MRLRLDSVLNELIEEELHDDKMYLEGDDYIVALVLLEWEASDRVMRGIDKKGRVIWKASPRTLDRLADMEREARDDLRGW